jgi:DNA (cytosine-5)-methyltransferase 1
MQPRNPRFTAIDLFAGGGGLTLGLKRAGFRVVAAVEVERHAFTTYKANHPDVTTYKQDVRTVDGVALAALAPNAHVTMLAGCPPCQGFTSLTSKYRRADPRNDLVLEMARLCEEIKPTVVMMENVPGLVSKGRPLFAEFVRRLVKAGYVIRYDTLQVADFGVPQNRRRLVLLAGKGFAVPLPKPTHSATGANGLAKWRVVEDVIRGLPRPVLLECVAAEEGPKAVNWHVVRKLSSENRQRLRVAKVGKHWKHIPKKFRPTCHQETDTGFQNVYGRMRWNQVAPTITGGCTTLSKGRFGHPSQLRTLSVHEAALIQTFPPDYIFDTPYMEYVCNIVGNALPCDFAEILAKQCADIIRIRRTATQA